MYSQEQMTKKKKKVQIKGHLTFVAGSPQKYVSSSLFTR